MVNAAFNDTQSLWTDTQCMMGMLAVRANVDLSQFPTSEAYALAEDAHFLAGRTRRTCGDILSSLFPVTSQGSSFGQAACDPQVLIFAYVASAMRDAGGAATADTPLAKNVETLFELKWSFDQFGRFMENRA